MAHVIGDSELTLQVGDTGLIERCTWPGPGHANQLGDTDFPPIQWCIETEGKTYWLDGTAGGTTQKDGYVVSIGTCGEDSKAYVQRIAVHPDESAFVVQLRLTGFSSIPKVYFTADFSPNVYVAPGIPVGAFASSTRSDFMAFLDPQSPTVFHFSPDLPSQRDRERARLLEKLAGSEIPLSLDGFKDGIWIGYTALEGVVNRSCGYAGTGRSVRTEIEMHQVGTRKLTAGFTDSAMEISPAADGVSYVATVIVAIAPKQQGVSKALASVTLSGIDGISTRLIEKRAETLGRIPALGQFDASLRLVLEEAMLLILQSQDPESGAIVVSPAGEGASRMDWPEDTAFASMALARCGMLKEARKHVEFLLNRVRADSRGRILAGTLATAYHASGEEGLPGFVVDTTPAAGLLWSTRTLLEQLDADARKEFLTQYRDPILLLGSFLNSWKDPRSGEAIPAFDIALWRDSASMQKTQIHHVGLSNGSVLAAWLGESGELWKQTQSEFRGMIRSRSLDAGGRWIAGVTLPLEPAELYIPTEPAWLDLQSALDQTLATATGRALGDALYTRAVLANSDRSAAEGFRSQLPSLIARACGFDGSGGITPDVRIAAQCLLACLLLSE